MKKLFYLLLIILAVASCTMQPTKKTAYSISVNLQGLNEGTVYLQKRVSGETIKLDSADAATPILFNGNIEMAEMYSIGIKDKRGSIPVFVEAADINIIGHIDSLRQAIITGSPAHDEYDAFNKQFNIFDERLRKIYGDYRTADQEQNEELKGQLEKQMEAIQVEQVEFTYKYVSENKASIVSSFIAYQNNYDFELTQLDSIASGFDPSINSSVYVQLLKERVATLQSVAIGKKYIDFTMNNTEDVPVQFSSLIKGKYTLIDFWAAWCGPCRGENPNVVAVYNDYKDKGFDVIGISLDQSKDKWLEAIEADKLTWNHLSDLKYWNSAAAKLYGVNSIPHSILIDGEGIIIAKNLRAEELRKKISELLD
ncbi:MAG: AhpC/TSA family protein [Bacteroidetes bacterium]|nr:AhpC/TSA family protein [Bacteroidota bacterium]